MSVKKYTDATGVAEIWAKVKSIIPSKTSDLTNDSSFITYSDLPASTAVPTASTISEFDGSSHINSEDMLDEDITSFVNALDIVTRAPFVIVTGSGTISIGANDKATCNISLTNVPIGYSPVAFTRIALGSSYLVCSGWSAQGGTVTCTNITSTARDNLTVATRILCVRNDYLIDYT